MFISQDECAVDNDQHIQIIRKGIGEDLIQVISAAIEQNRKEQEHEGQNNKMDDYWNCYKENRRVGAGKPLLLELMEQYRQDWDKKEPDRFKQERLAEIKGAANPAGLQIILQDH